MKILQEGPVQVAKGVDTVDDGSGLVVEGGSVLEVLLNKEAAVVEAGIEELLVADGL